MMAGISKGSTAKERFDVLTSLMDDSHEVRKGDRLAIGEKHSRLSALVHTLEQAEGSTRGEGIDPNDNPAYLHVKRLLLSGEVALDEAHLIFESFFPANVTEIISMPRDGKRRGSSIL